MKGFGAGLIDWHSHGAAVSGGVRRPARDTRPRPCGRRLVRAWRRKRLRVAFLPSWVAGCPYSPGRKVCGCSVAGGGVSCALERGRG